MMKKTEEKQGGGKTVEVLATGGFDSTFRLIQLSKCNVDIQLFYLSDNRKSEINELNAISKIVDILKLNKNTRCTFRTLKVINMNERISDSTITEAYERILKKDFFGTQYDWLGRFATVHKGIELSIHKDDKAMQIINKYGRLVKVTDSIIGDYYIIDRERSEPDLIKLFGNYNFPLADYTKLQMKNYYLEYGYKEIMDLTWFCFSPINGKPCGKCNPCIYTIEEGLKERFTRMALLRYYVTKAKRAIKGKIVKL